MTNSQGAVDLLPVLKTKGNHMARKANPLNISKQPGVGMAYIIQNVQTKQFIRAATTCQRDLKRNKEVKQLRSFSNKIPFFTAKIGSRYTEEKVLKFLCSADHEECLDETGTYRWTGISLKQAQTDKMTFDEPNYTVKKITINKSVPVKPVKKAKAKVIKPKVIKPLTVSSTEDDMQTDEFEAEIDNDFKEDLARIQAQTAK